MPVDNGTPVDSETPIDSEPLGPVDDGTRSEELSIEDGG
jgi:hypothetical protein